MNPQAAMGGGYVAAPYPAGPYADPAAMGINPALLTVVAAQMGGAGGRQHAQSFWGGGRGAAGAAACMAVLCCGVAAGH